MLKVCHITSVHPATDTRIFMKECRSLAAHGYATHLVATNCQNETKDQVQIHSSGPLPRKRSIRLSYTAPRAIWRALQLKADVYHLHDPELLAFAPLLRTRSARVIYDAHEDLPKQTMSKAYIRAELRPTISQTLDVMEKFLVRYCDVIVAATASIASRFDDLPVPVVVVNNYPLKNELWTEASAHRQNSNKMVYIGALAPGRGIRELIAATEMSTGELHLAGKFSSISFRNELEKMTGWRKTIYHGVLDRDGVKTLLADSAFGLVTLHAEPNHIESQPIKLFEYLSAGLPIIASDFEHWRSLLNGSECALFVDPLNPSQIALAMNELLAEPKRRKQWGQNARTLICKRFSWENEERTLLKLYRDLTAAAGSSISRS